MPCTLSQLTLTSSCCPVAKLPSCQAANQLTEVTNCKLRQLCYDSFRNQQLSSRGISWRGREREGERERAEQLLGCSSSMTAAAGAGHRHFSHSRSLSLALSLSSDTNTFITAATHRWAQTKGNAKRMHSFDVCTHFCSYCSCRCRCALRRGTRCVA